MIRIKNSTIWLIQAEDSFFFDCQAQPTYKQSFWTNFTSPWKPKQFVYWSWQTFYWTHRILSIYLLARVLCIKSFLSNRRPSNKYSSHRRSIISNRKIRRLQISCILIRQEWLLWTLVSLFSIFSMSNTTSAG